MKEHHNMKSESFADLGVSEAVSSELAQRGIDSPFAVQKHGDSRRARRP